MSVVDPSEASEFRYHGAALWALEATADNVILVDPDFRIIFINRATAELNGISQDSVIGKTIWEAWPGNIGTEIERNYRMAMAEGIPIRFHHSYFEEDRFDLWLEIHVCPSPDGLAIFFRDISEAKRHAVREAEDQQRLARAIEATDLGVWRVNLPFDGQPFNLSPQVRRHLGITPDEEISMPEFVALLHPDDIQMTTDAIIRSIEDHVPYDVVYRTIAGDGRTRWVRAYGNAFYREDGIPYQFDGYTLDYTERVETEHELRSALGKIQASEERFRQLAELSPSTVWFAEPDGGLSYISQDFYDSTGMTPASALPTGWISVVHPDDIHRVETEWDNALRDYSRYDTEFRIKHSDGNYRWISARALPVHDEDGNVAGWMGSNSDIQDKKLNEAILQTRVAERTVELQRLIAESEGFNYSISHDLRAPLRNIVYTASVLLEEAGPELSGAHRILLERQAYNANRLGDLIDELLRLSRLARVEVRRMKLNMTNKARNLVQALETTCKFEIQENMEAEGDPDLVLTVLQNLIENACKFSPGGGRIRIGTENGVFHVRDEGIGFEMRFAPKIFLPFERLVSDREFPGTGIGLANVKRIVERHNGRIWVDSEPGVGTTFFFTLAP
jgi:PAS domain S-box-containing protein